jgi:hypothetical protein
MDEIKTEGRRDDRFAGTMDDVYDKIEDVYDKMEEGRPLISFAGKREA